MPCNHKELLNAECQTKNVFILKCGGFSDVDYMLKIDGNGYGLNIKAPNFGCQFPNCQKIKNKIIYYQWKHISLWCMEYAWHSLMNT